MARVEITWQQDIMIRAFLKREALIVPRANLYPCWLLLARHLMLCSPKGDH
ncbi:MAG: hypothetical protein HWN70_11425 [Desulfobacterales bacterium]|nr:hypothetical protein [Desulfobacterales bacterium]